MTAPQRPFLLNRQIAIAARDIAHRAMNSCKGRHEDGYRDDEHNAACNMLKRQIEELALNVKLASLQPSNGVRGDAARSRSEGDVERGRTETDLC